MLFRERERHLNPTLLDMILKSCSRDEAIRVKLDILFTAAGQSKGLADKDVLVLPMDLTDLTKHQECFNKVLDHFGCVSVRSLVN